MTIFEKLKQGMLDEITVKVCDFLIEDCDMCPKFISSRCKESCNEMNLRRLRTETKIMTNIEKLKQGMFDDMNKEAKTQKDAPKDAPEYVPGGWINLKTSKGTIYIVASEIVALAPILPDTSVVMNGAITKVFTRGDEDAAWLVCESVDEVMEKIKNA